MVSGGIRPKRTFGQKIKSHQNDIEVLYGLNNSVFTQGGVPSGRGGQSGAGAPGVSEVKFLPLSGGTLSGPITYDPKLVTIDSDGHIDITKTSEKDSSYILMTGAGTPDDLNFIDGAQHNGQILVLQGTASQVINAIHASLRSISNIVGTGVDNIITVTTSAVHGLTTGAKINIIGTTNFDAQNKSITVTSTTIYTYDLGSTGSATPETTGTSQSGNIVTSDGVDIEIDGTVGINTIPVVTLIFDVTVIGNGAWRVIHGSEASGGGVSGASQQLDNLSSVAINTSLISDTDDTDDLGSASIEWKDLYIDGVAKIDTLIVDVISTFNGTSNAFTNDVIFNGDTLFNTSPTLANTKDLLPATDLGSSLGDSTHSFSLGYIHEIRFDEVTKKIASVGTLDMLYQVPAGGDMVFAENGTAWFTLDGGNNNIKFNRPVDMDNNSISKIDDIEVDGDLNHDGTLAGFYGTTPIAQQLVTTLSGSETLAQVISKVNIIIASLGTSGIGIFRHS